MRWERDSANERLALVPGVASATQLSVRDDFGCARVAGERVVCWGSNELAQLGRGKVSEAERAGPVPGVSAALEVRTGAVRTCVRLRGGSVVCWGDLFAQEAKAPSPMPGFTGVTSLAACSRPPFSG